MLTSNNSPNSDDVAFVATFASVPDLVEKKAAYALIAVDYNSALSDDNGGAVGGINKMLDELMFNVVSASSRKRYNSVNKVVLKYCFEVGNNLGTALTEWLMELLGQQNLQIDHKK